MRPTLLPVAIGSVLLTLFGQSFLSDFALVLPPLGQVLQQLRLLTLEGDNRIQVAFCQMVIRWFEFGS